MKLKLFLASIELQNYGPVCYWRVYISQLKLFFVAWMAKMDMDWNLKKNGPTLCQRWAKFYCCAWKINDELLWLALPDEICLNQVCDSTRAFL